jgi:predicted regulator of Ras-like GTPase activity (Roadblock/LC7/MglB family)
MNNIDTALQEIMTLNGALATSLVDWESGMVLGMQSNGNFNIELASAGNAEVVKAKMATMKSLNLAGDIQDIMISLTDQIHIIHILKSNPELCLYVALTSAQSNLALARNKLKTVAAS